LILVGWACHNLILDSLKLTFSFIKNNKYKNNNIKERRLKKLKNNIGGQVTWLARTGV
jgi:hypothetical protein